MTTPDFGRGTVRVQGARELRRALKDAGEDLKDLSRINKEASSIVAAAAKSRAPVGGKQRRSGRNVAGGRLAKSIRARGTRTAGIVSAGGKAVPYAGAIHWGRHYWPRKGHARATPSPIAPRYYISDAAASTQPEWVDLYETHIDELIERITND